MLKPLDIVVLVALIVPGHADDETQVQLAQRLHLSQATIHRALKRLERSSLWRVREPRTRALLNLLVHGVPYVFPPVFGAPARGVLTAHSGPGVPDDLAKGPALVWPCEQGTAAGTSLEALHKVVPLVALEDPAFYEAMSLIEVLRMGRVRERQAAENALAVLLGLHE